ncbi:MAG TPA: hypothetical protein VGK67_35095 [Myxococcales bacterium]|jgi:hypothetical protein
MRQLGIALLVVFAVALSSCKKEGTAPENTALDRSTHEPKFPIAAGNHAQADCNSCHGAFDTFTRFSCTTAGCHEKAQVDPVHAGLADYAYEDARCLACHPKGDVNFEHTKFPIGTGATHADRTCSNCHKAADRKQFDCTACHEHDQPTMDGAHGAMAGYAWDSAKCYQCHPDGQIPPFDHTWFPVGTGATHTDRTCSGCHPSADRSQFTCTACHSHDQGPTDTNHAGIAGYAWDSPKCLQCHPDGKVTMVDHGKYFPIATGDLHAGVACSDCHTTPGARKVTTCNVCHSHAAADEAPKHAGRVPDFSTDTVLCLRCHADAQVKRVATHLPFRIDSATKHFTTGCLLCHPGLRVDKPYGADFAPAALDCLTCHPRLLMDDVHQNFPAYQYQSQSCIQGGCHADGSKPGGL